MVDINFEKMILKVETDYDKKFRSFRKGFPECVISKLLQINKIILLLKIRQSRERITIIFIYKLYFSTNKPIKGSLYASIY